MVLLLISYFLQIMILFLNWLYGPDFFNETIQDNNYQPGRKTVQETTKKVFTASEPSQAVRNQLIWNTDFCLVLDEVDRTIYLLFKCKLLKQNQFYRLKNMFGPELHGKPKKNGENLLKKFSSEVKWIIFSGLVQHAIFSHYY